MSIKEIKKKLSRLILNGIFLVILYFVYEVIPYIFTPIIIPGLNISGEQLSRISILIILVILLARVLPDILFFSGIGADLILGQLGIQKEKRPSRRVARDLVVMILIVLISEAAVPLFSDMPSELGLWLSTITSFVAIVLFIILLYDIGKSLYNVLKGKVDNLAYLIAEQVKKKDKSNA